MGFSYFDGKTWAEVTRDERFFCQHLYGLIRYDVPGFIRKLNDLTLLNLPVDEEWEVGFEVCFYRDHRFMSTRNGHVWHGDNDMYSPKRTFDLCLFSHHNIVIIEAKAQQGFVQDQLMEFKKDRDWVKAAIAVVKNDDATEHDVEVDVIALASSAYINKLDWGNFNTDAIFSGRSPITWKDLAKHYRRNHKEYDQVLLRADAIYEESRPGGENNNGYKSGKALIDDGQNGKTKFIGRSGGINGKLLKTDIETGGWETQLYETSLSETRPNNNWFTVHEFTNAINIK